VAALKFSPSLSLAATYSESTSTRRVSNLRPMTGMRRSRSSGTIPSNVSRTSRACPPDHQCEASRLEQNPDNNVSALYQASHGSCGYHRVRLGAGLKRHRTRLRARSPRMLRAPKLMVLPAAMNAASSSDGRPISSASVASRSQSSALTPSAALVAFKTRSRRPP
jgi:hypothetical protein